MDDKPEYRVITYVRQCGAYPVIESILYEGEHTDAIVRALEISECNIWARTGVVDHEGKLVAEVTSNEF